MMGTVVPETCWAYKKHNKIISGNWLVFYSSEMYIIQTDLITRSSPGTGKWITYHNCITNEKKNTT